jgi:hypothetical protein
MTRRELLSEGMRFVLLGVLMLAVSITISVIRGGGRSVGHLALDTLFFIAAILMLMAIAGGGYMLLRGLFRSPWYVPPPHC